MVAGELHIVSMHFRCAKGLNLGTQLKALGIQPYDLSFMGGQWVEYEGNAYHSLLLVSRKKELPSNLLTLVPFLFFY